MLNCNVSICMLELLSFTSDWSSLGHANIHGFYNRNSSKTLPNDIYRGKNRHDLECFSAKLHLMNNNMMWIRFVIADDTKTTKILQKWSRHTNFALYLYKCNQQ